MINSGAIQVEEFLEEARRFDIGGGMIDYRTFAEAMLGGGE